MMRIEGTLSLGLLLCIWAYLFAAVLSDCPFPKTSILNGQIVYQDSEHANWTTATEMYLLRFKCLSGYTLQGAQAILCHSAKWTNKLPRCIRMECSDPPSIENGHYVLHTGVNKGPTIGSKATYTCDIGYEMENNADSTLICYLFENINSAQWKGALANCRKKDACSNPGVSPNGVRTVAGYVFFIGDVVEFSCNDDFELIGEEGIECLPGGSWSSPRPLCRPLEDYCEHPPTIPHGILKGDKEGDFYVPYEEVEVMCEPGYKYKGASEFIMCEEESGWEDDFSECVEAFCDLPEPLIDGNIPEIASMNITTSGNVTIFPYDFELTYLCNKGFRLVGGDSWRFCDSKGWSGKTPHCEVIRCPDPGVPEHGTRLCNSFEIDQKVTFKCFTGYELLGSFERYCMPNGQWGGILARCDDPNSYCPNPGIPINGMKNSSRYEMGDGIRFTCQPGFMLLGSEIRECLPNRTWSGEEVTCTGPNDFDNTVKISDILKAAIADKAEEQERKLKEYNEALKKAKFSMHARMLVTNFPGRYILYFAFDSSGSVKEPNFRRSIEFAKAIVRRITISEDGARAGALTFSSKAENQFLPLDYNTTEGVLEALDRIEYTSGGTSTTSALATIREEQIPLTTRNLQKGGGKKKQKSIIFILTDGRANMGGDPEEEAKLLKAAGAEIYCIGITNSPLIGSLRKIATDEKKVFILQSYASMDFIIQKIIKGEIDYSRCGLGLEEIGKTDRGRMVGGRQASDPWPWMAALYIESELQCGGSIIHEHYILTAAHCMYNQDEFATVRNVKEVVVTLGITDVKNETNKEEFEVEKIIIHPQYKIGSIFDYDIALLKLERPIEFNALVRPICLPPEELAPNTTLYKADELTVATGWGHTGVLQARENAQITIADNLKEVILPIQTTERCNQSAIDHKDQRIKKNIFTERMFCVGDGNGGNDTCKGDSGGPLMQSQQNEDGYVYWTQVGIVSWGVGCGLPDTYGYYTHVQKLMQWLRSTIQENET